MPMSHVFLDRDGTLLEDPGYLHRIEDYALRPGVIDALRELVAAGWRLAIVTNQSGIGRGLFAESDFHRLQARLRHDLESHGIAIEATYFCPHRPDEGCGCRKPETGMLRQAERELGARLEESWVIGDADSDVELAIRGGCRAVLLAEGGNAGPGDEMPDCAWVAADMAAAARIILDDPRA